MMLDPVPPPAPAPEEPVSLHVNGRAADISLPKDATLLEALRNNLGLTASRFGCGLEQCGACMVLVDDQPRHACRLVAADQTGCMIRTPESLAEDALGRLLVESFIAYQAAQCGYCLGGILITSYAWLRGLKGEPSRAEIARTLDPHLCRCGAHPRILAAVAATAKAWLDRPR
ncbi:MAG: 2Fe-2S iron-sulfur cluster binding domain-containing protein [Alphaproteobacteria bacterium]|nr:2Fe-2S iron-sulfur cluster binding domain-containing protein [Alphaproteobacteria bacterium]